LSLITHKVHYSYRAYFLPIRYWSLLAVVAFLWRAATRETHCFLFYVIL